LVLSSENYRGTSLAAVGVAAHEAGHALQHRESYAMLEFRMALVPTTRIASGVIPFLLIASMFVFRQSAGLILDLAIVAFAILTVFQLVTLPVEYDASRRAKAQLVSLGILDQDEMPGVNEVLDSAALTYLAAFMGALLNLLSLLSRRN
jgi:Zn-dependent membrane protease YugP